MDTTPNESAQASEWAEALATTEDSRDNIDSLESAISFAIEWANLGGG